MRDKQLHLTSIANLSLESVSVNRFPRAMTQPIDQLQPLQPHPSSAASAHPPALGDPLAALAAHAAAASNHSDSASFLQHHNQHDADDNDDLDDEPNDGSQPPASKRARTSQQASRSRIAQACSVCRKKKIKCDGQRPACSYCVESNFPCSYTPPKRRGPPRKMPVIDPAEDAGMTTVNGVPAAAIAPTTMAGMHAHVNAMAAAPTPEALGFGTPTDPFRVPTDQEMDAATQTILHRIYLDPVTGDLMHLRNLGRSNGAHFLRDDFPDFYRFGSLIADKPENVPLCSMPVPTTGFNNLNPEELPPQPQQELLINFYFEYLRPLFPVLEEGQVTLYLAKCAERNFYFEVQAFFGMCSLWYVRMGRPRTADFIHPSIHIEKAKLLLPRVFTVSPSLSRSCGLLMLAMALAGDGAGSSWSLAGAAIRVAQDVGLHVDLGRLPIHEQFKGEQVRRAHVVWWCCYVVDRMLAMALGRPVAIREEDCAVPLPMPIRRTLRPGMQRIIPS
ncbi:hypothetical protein BCR44DRAFT_1026583 [Catenaria anguillulae PL171]|uniref:Zn(2)-C6 fungal-type domain-containing protein n=1 Tax=Catenaria anguillulae PL171 TaxID=765915 RepID=A0A1Y2HTC3_9FUNG|nr:hypothetical protein BCR44DRAFT_1026583 [Catenaria anguillulae PL171]